MLPRLVRASLAAVRRFSAEATEAAVESRPASVEVSGGTGGAKSGGGGRDTLGRRLLSLVYTKRSAAIAIRQWKEEGRAARKYELNRIVRELRRLKRYKHALEVCEWMRTQDDIKLVSGDYAVHLDLIAKVRNMNSAEKFFEDLPEKMRDHTTCTALLHTYVQYKEADKAEALMEKMSECGFVKSPLPYNHLLSLYISLGQLEKVPGLLEELKKNMKPDIVTYNLWLNVCASENDMETAEKIVVALKQQRLDPDWVTYSTLTNIYIKNSLKDKATLTVKEMEKRLSRKVRVAYASLISLHMQLENKDEVVRIWKKMKSMFQRLNHAEYISMISSLVKLNDFKEAEKLYAEWESGPSTGDTRIPNLLLSAYISNDEMGKAENFYNRMVEKGISPSYTTFEVLTRCYLKQEQVEKVLDFFTKMVGSVKKWNPDRKIIQEVFGVLEGRGDIERAEQMLATLRGAGHVSTEIYKSLLRTYAKVGKMPLVISERMNMDNVLLDDETQELIRITSKMCVSDVPRSLS